jgi:hypothetical protein
MPLKVSTIDDLLQVYQNSDLSSETIAQLAKGVELQLDESIMQEGRQWMKAQLQDGRVGFVLGPSARSHTTLGCAAGSEPRELSPAAGRPSAVASYARQDTSADVSGLDSSSRATSASDTSISRSQPKRELVYVWIGNPKSVLFPKLCPCCGSAADSSLEIEGSKITGNLLGSTVHTKSFEVPYCSACKDHFPNFGPAILVCILAGLTVFLAPIVIERGLFIRLLVLLSVLGIWAYIVSVYIGKIRRLMKPSCIRQGRAVAMGYGRASDTVFIFASHSYAKAFELANSLDVKHVQTGKYRQFSQL